MAEVLEKLVGQQYLHSLNESEATDLSLKLGLVNRYTSFVMVSEQSVANADGLPKLEVVPQMTSRLVSKGLARMGRGIQSKAFLSDNASYDIPSFLRREASVQDDPNVQMDLSPKLFLRETSTDVPPENAMLTKVERRLSRILLKGKIPTLTLLLRWGLNQDLAEAIQEYFIQHQISDTVCYIATVLLWLNKSKGILSGASMDILQKKIDEASSQDVLSTDALIQVLEEIGEYTA
jgi:hypothetical protein